MAPTRGICLLEFCLDFGAQHNWLTNNVRGSSAPPIVVQHRYEGVFIANCHPPLNIAVAKLGLSFCTEFILKVQSHQIHSIAFLPRRKTWLQTTRDAFLVRLWRRQRRRVFACLLVREIKTPKGWQFRNCAPQNLVSEIWNRFPSPGHFPQQTHLGQMMNREQDWWPTQPI